MEDFTTYKISLKNVGKCYEKYQNSHVRFSLTIMVTSVPWTTNNKQSVWIEDPIQEGKTILCTFNEDYQNFKNMELHGQFKVCNAKIVHNQIENREQGWPTYAAYQLVLDEESKITRLTPVEVITEPIKDLAEIPKLVEEDSIGEFLNLIAVPVEDLGSNYPEDEKSPRRIKMVDQKSKFEITWTLWNEDKDASERTDKMMGKPILIRNGIVKYYDQFEEWQVRSLICNVKIVC